MTNEQIFIGEMTLARAVRHVSNRAATSLAELRHTENSLFIGPGSDRQAILILNDLLDELKGERIAKFQRRRRRNAA